MGTSEPRPWRCNAGSTERDSPSTWQTKSWSPSPLPLPTTTPRHTTWRAGWKPALVPSGHPDRTQGEASGRGKPRPYLRPPPLRLRHVVGQILAQLLDGGALEAGHVHLRDAKALGHLSLRELVHEAHDHDPALALGQVFHGLLQQLAHLDAVQVGVGPTDGLAQLASLAVL